MLCTRIFALLFGLAGTPSVSAQDAAWRFQWPKGRTLTYRANHATTVSEVVDGNKTETTSRLTLVKQWKVADVDPSGIATLHLSLAALRTENTKPNGEKLLFDSANLDQSTPELRQMKEHLGKTLAIVRIDGYGRIHEVKHGSAAKYEAEPPFALVLPAAAPKEGQAWVRNYKITLEPPQGTGERFPATQKYTCTKISGGQAHLAVTTELKSLPESPQERLPLLQKEVEGQAVFDIESGRLRRVELIIDKTVQNHQGPGSSYHFVSSYIEELTSAK